MCDKIFEPSKWKGLATIKAKVVKMKEYDFIGEFHKGYALVRKNNLWGMINKKGEEIIRPDYEYIDYNPSTGYFTCGAAIVMCGGKYGFVDKNGMKLCPIKYDEVLYFKGGYAKVRLGDEWFGIDKRRRILKL